MQKYITLAALVATAAASTSFNLNDSCVTTEPLARIHNRCNYPVHIWSVLQGQGCPSNDGAVLQTGQFYQENYRPAVNKVGTSIKISKSPQCKGVDITQLEYYIETENPRYNSNFFDVSWVDCQHGNCPASKEGYYLKSGNVNGLYKADSKNQICPILSCSDRASCSKVTYINPDDVQTKSCDPKANIDLYLCGGDAPGSEPSTPVKSAAASSSKAASTSCVQKTKAAAITPAPAQEKSKALHIKTEVVYVTKYADHKREAKRHAHGHRHQHFKA